MIREEIIKSLFNSNKNGITTDIDTATMVFPSIEKGFEELQDKCINLELNDNCIVYLDFNNYVIYITLGFWYISDSSDEEDDNEEDDNEEDDNDEDDNDDDYGEGMTAGSADIVLDDDLDFNYLSSSLD